MKKIISIVSILVILLVVIFFIVPASSEEKYFNKVELSHNNVITNSNGIAYYDTILSVGLDQMNLVGTLIVISELSNAAKEQFADRELKAHIRYYNGTYYLFISNLNRDEAIEVICHEIIHINQYYSGRLFYDESGITWEGQLLQVDTYEYDSRPWETEAFIKGNNLSNIVSDILYK